MAQKENNPPISKEHASSAQIRPVVHAMLLRRGVVGSGGAGQFGAGRGGAGLQGPQMSWQVTLQIAFHALCLIYLSLVCCAANTLCEQS